MKQQVDGLSIIQLSETNINSNQNKNYSTVFNKILFGHHQAM